MDVLDSIVHALDEGLVELLLLIMDTALGAERGGGVLTGFAILARCNQTLGLH